jgi:hypothetical protein
MNPAIEALTKIKKGIMKKIVIAALCFGGIGGCASLKYPGWEKVSIETSVVDKPCELKPVKAEHCYDADCNTWFKKRATVYGGNTVVRHDGNYGSYFYCASGLPLYKEPVKPQTPEKCHPVHDEKYQQESRVNIKGYYLGIDKCEIEETLGTPDASFTVVGIPVGQPKIEFIDEKLSSFDVSMPSSMFYRLQSAIQSKFPEIKCKDSIIHNRMNASFDQIECTLDFEKGRLSIERYSSDTTKSSLSLISKQALKKILMEEMIQEKDI